MRGGALLAFLSALPLVLVFSEGQGGGADTWKAATKLSEIRITDGAVTVKTLGGQARYKIFDIQTPPKVVVELYDTWIPSDFQREFAPTEKSYALGVEKVRVAQFASVPQHIARVVLDLSRPLDYSHSKKDGTLSLQLGAAHVPLAAAGSPAAAAPPAAGVAKTKPFKDILKELPKDLIDVNFQEVDTAAAVAMLIGKLESITGEKINLITAQDVVGTVNLRLEGVPFNEVFSLVLNSKSLVATQTGANILKVMGRTTYMAERSQGNLATRIVPLNYADAAQLMTTLSTIRSQEGSKANIIVAREINSLIITDTEEGFLQLQKLIKELDVRPISVSIEAKIIDLKLDNSVDYGIDWKYAKDWNKNQPGELDKRTIGSVDPNSGSPAGGNSGAMPSGGAGEPVVLAPGLPSLITSALSFGRVTDTSFLQMRIAAGVKSGRVKLLSNPRIVTLNNQAASITVGTQIPIPTTTISQTGTTQNISYTNTGILLNVTPTVNPDRYVRMLITPTVSRPGALSAGGAPPIDTRTANTVIITKDGETVVIGGLIDEATDKQVTKVPILGDIPLLGWLFKRQGTSKIRTELLVFVTPNILD